MNASEFSFYNFQKSFTKIISKCLLLFAELPVRKPEEHSNLERLHRNLTEMLGEETVNKLLVEKLDEVLVSTVKSVYDSDCFRNVVPDLEVVVLESDSTHHTVEVFHSIIEYLQVVIFLQIFIFQPDQMFCFY